MDDMNDLKEQLQNENLAIVGSQEFEDNQLSEKEAIEYFQGQQDDLQDNQDELKNQNRLLEQQEFIKLDNDLVDKEIENQTRDDQSQTQPFVKDFIMENSQIKDHLQTNDQINNGQLNKDSQLNDEPQQNQELQLYEEQQQTYEQQQNEQQQQNEELYQNEDIINNQNIQQNENTQQFDDQQSNIETQNLNSYQNERQQFNHGQYQLQDSKIQQQNKDTQLMCDQQEIVQINQHENENNKNEEIINQLDLNEIYEEDQHSIEKQMKGSQFTNQLTQNEDNLREINDNFDQELRNSTIKDESQRDIGQLDMSSIVQDDQKKDDDCQIYLEIQKKNNKDSIMDNVMQNVVNKTSKQVQGLIKILNDDPHNLRQRKNNNSRIIMDTSVNQEDQLKLKEAMKEKQLLESRLKQLDKKIESLCVNQFVQMEENIEKEQPRVQTQLIDPKDLVKKYNKQRREMEKKREIERMEFLQLIEKNDIQTKQQEEVKLKIESEEKKIRVLKRMEEHNQKKELFKLQQKSSQDLLRKIHMNRPKKNLNDIVRQRSNEVLQRQPPIYMDKKTLNQFAKEHDELVKQKLKDMEKVRLEQIEKFKKEQKQYTSQAMQRVLSEEKLKKKTEKSKLQQLKKQLETRKQYGAVITRMNREESNSLDRQNDDLKVNISDYQNEFVQTEDKKSPTITVKTQDNKKIGAMPWKKKQKQDFIMPQQYQPPQKVPGNSDKYDNFLNVNIYILNIILQWFYFNHKIDQLSIDSIDKGIKIKIKIVKNQQQLKSE